MSGGGYAKLFASIIHSTIWREAPHVRLVWVTMLAMADAEGYVGASVPGLADAARVSLGEVEESLVRLGEPDPYSRNPANEGRRIAPAERGWLILNYAEYRKRSDSDAAKDRKRRWWRENRGKSSGSLAASSASSLDATRPNSTQAEAEAEADPEGNSSEAIPLSGEPPDRSTGKVEPPEPKVSSADIRLVVAAFNLGREELLRHSRAAATRGVPQREVRADAKSAIGKKRRTAAANILDALGDVEAACRAARNLALSEHHRGENDRNEAYYDLTYVARQPEKFLGYCPGDDDEFRRKLAQQTAPRIGAMR